ncbi:hypothetical protein BC830DRAFT_585184 [Chytriomyces sp. MP71]|nr:hypothetical protein BC830DRAFT_585184 [Chytriomyces sp. MP71]
MQFIVSVSVEALWRPSTYVSAFFVASHIFLVSFDIYMLYYAYLISNFDKWIRVISVSFVMFRIGWAITELHQSTFAFDISLNQCAYYQDPVTAYYNIVDIACDELTTMVNIYLIVFRLNLSSFRKVSSIHGATAKSGESMVIVSRRVSRSIYLTSSAFKMNARYKRRNVHSRAE